MPGGPHPGCTAVEGFRLPGPRPGHREICQIHWRFLPLQARQSGGAGRIRSPRPSRKSVLTARPEPPKRGEGASTAAVKPRPNCITQQTCNFFTRRKAFLQERSAYWPATDSAEPGNFLLPPSQIPSPGTPPRHRHFSSRARSFAACGPFSLPLQRPQLQADTLSKELIHTGHARPT